MQSPHYFSLLSSIFFPLIIALGFWLNPGESGQGFFIGGPQRQRFPIKPDGPRLTNAPFWGIGPVRLFYTPSPANSQCLPEPSEKKKLWERSAVPWRLEIEPLSLLHETSNISNALKPVPWPKGRAQLKLLSLKTSAFSLLHRINEMGIDPFIKLFDRSKIWSEKRLYVTLALINHS